MRQQAPRRRRRPSVVMVVLWALATVVLATIASAALGDAGLPQVEFERALTVVLLGEALVYIMALGGGGVAGPVLVVTFVLAFVLRGLIALLATELAPPGPLDDLLLAARYYYVSCWHAAAVQILLVALLLRLVRRALRRPRRARRPAPRPALVDAEEEQVRRDHLLAALAEAPDAPPLMATMIEEQQIGDLGEVEGRAAEEGGPELRLDRPLPFAEEAVSEAVVAEIAQAEEETAPAPETPEAAEAEEAGTPSPGEDTQALEPVSARPAGEGEGVSTQAEAMPSAERLQEMVDAVVSRVGGEGERMQIRVWDTAEGQTVLGAMPAELPEAEIEARARGLVRSHLDLCAQLGGRPTDLQMCAAGSGGYALRAVDDAGALALLLASAAEQATGRLELMAEAVFEPLSRLGGLDRAAGPPAARPAASGRLRQDVAVGEQLSAASARLNGRLPTQWEAYRDEQGEVLALAGPAGTDHARVAWGLGACATAAAAFCQALQLGEPSWLALSGRSAGVVACRARLGSEAALVGAVSSPPLGIGEALWELQRLTRSLATPAA